MVEIYTIKRGNEVFEARGFHDAAKAVGMNPWKFRETQIPFEVNGFEVVSVEDKAIKLRVNGEDITFSQLARKLGVNRGSLYCAVMSGRGIEGIGKGTAMNNAKPCTLERNGKVLEFPSKTAAARFIGVSPSTFCSNKTGYISGWTIK